MTKPKLTSQEKARRLYAKTVDYSPVNRFGKAEPTPLTDAEKAAGHKICKQCYYDGRPYVHPVSDFWRFNYDGPKNGQLFKLCKSCMIERRFFEKDKRAWVERSIRKKAMKKDLAEKGYYDEQGNPRHEPFKENHEQKE